MASQDHDRFHLLIAPHLEAAYNLARWLTGSDAEAADVLQESSVRAFRFLYSMKTENSKAWFLKIVRNTSYSVLKARRHEVQWCDKNDSADPTPSAEILLIDRVTARELHLAIAELPPEFREILILREFEDLSYEEIAVILQAPAGTVMSRLARARTQLKTILLRERGQR